MIKDIKLNKLVNFNKQNTFIKKQIKRRLGTLKIRTPAIL